MPAPATYPVETIAKLLLLTPRRVQQLSSEGVMPKAARGQYEIVPAVQGYVRYLRERAIGADLPAGESEHKVRLLKARADIAEFEAERLSGELVPTDRVERTWAEIVARFRLRALAIAPKASPMVAVETSIETCHEIIETYVHEALAELGGTDVGPAPTLAGDADGLPHDSAAAEIEGVGVGGSLPAAVE